jgi:hypothetical protein
LKAHLQWTVAIRPAKGAKAHRITKIASLAGDGFSVLAPCHKAQTGFLFKHPVVPGSPIPSFVAWDTAVAFTGRDRARLNYHADGFVEFSGDRPGRMTATKDPISGEVKGLGLFSLPLSRPPYSGGVVGLTVYGLDHFETEEKHDEIIVFEPRDFYYRNCNTQNANAWVVTIHAFPQGKIPAVRISDERSIITASLEQLNGPVGAVIDLVAISLPEEKLVLGLHVSRVHIPIEFDSGWLLAGPGDWAIDRRGHILMGMYPRGEIPLVRATSLQKAGSSSTGAAHLRPSKPDRKAPPRRKT